MIFGESDLRNPLWSILSVFLYFLGLQQKGQLVELAARQGQNNHKELWKELKFPCCFFFGEIFPQVLKGSQEKKGMLQHWSFIQADVDMSFPSTRNPWIKKSRSCKRYLISPASNMASLGYVDTFGCHVSFFLKFSDAQPFTYLDVDARKPPPRSFSSAWPMQCQTMVPFHNKGKLETGNTGWDGDTWRIIPELVRWIMVPCSRNARLFIGL